MNLSELLVIYLACGAPFGVNYFLQNRREKDFRTILLKSFLTVFVWIPYALRLLHLGITKKLINQHFVKDSRTDAVRRKNLEQLQNEIWQSAGENKYGITIFEFREVLERYAGLTAAMRSAVAELPEMELLNIAGHPAKNLGAKCINRRNRLRLEFHQTLASKDFLQLLSRLNAGNPENLRTSAIEFVRILDDAETLRAVEKLFAVSAQTDNSRAVKQRENEVWNTNRPKPQPARQISVPLTSAMRQKTMMSKRD